MLDFTQRKSETSQMLPIKVDHSVARFAFALCYGVREPEILYCALSDALCLALTDFLV